MGGHLGGIHLGSTQVEYPYTPYEPLASVFSPRQGAMGATPKGVLVEHPALGPSPPAGRPSLRGYHAKGVLAGAQAHGPCRRTGGLVYRVRPPPMAPLT